MHCDWQSPVLASLTHGDSQGFRLPLKPMDCTSAGQEFRGPTMLLGGNHDLLPQEMGLLMEQINIQHGLYFSELLAANSFETVT